MAAYRRVYDSRHLQADCQEPGSAPEPYARQSSTGYFTFFQTGKLRNIKLCGEENDLFYLVRTLGAIWSTVLPRWRPRWSRTAAWRRRTCTDRRLGAAGGRRRRPTWSRESAGHRAVSAGARRRGRCSRPAETTVVRAATASRRPSE